MNVEHKIAVLENRKNVLLSNGKNTEGCGVLRKIERQLRNLKK